MSNTEIVSRFVAAWEARDVDAIMAFFAENAVYHNMPMPKATGLVEIRTLIDSIVGGAETIAFEMLHSAENAAGTVLNERVDRFLLKNGKSLSIPVVGIFEFTEGKITAWRDYFDMKDFEKQSAG